MRLTTFASAQGEASENAAQQADDPTKLPASLPAPPSVTYGPPQWARRSFTRGFAGTDFLPQEDGTLLCPAGHPLRLHEHRAERNGSLRLVYGARLAHCRPCHLRASCLESVTTSKPRQVSAVLRPLASSAPLPAVPPPVSLPHPVLWGDWPRCGLRRKWMQVLRTQTLSLHPFPPQDPVLSSPDLLFTRKMRAHWRLSWQERFARNALHPGSIPLSMTIYGLPASIAHYVGLPFMATA